MAHSRSLLIATPTSPRPLTKLPFCLVQPHVTRGKLSERQWAKEEILLNQFGEGLRQLIETLVSSFLLYKIS